MKRLIYILLATALPMAVLSGCQKIDDPVFDQSSSARVQALIDSTFETLTASPEGWYLADRTGYGNDNSGYGGYWFWMKFNDDYTVEVAAEMDLTDAKLIGAGLAPKYPAGSTVKSDFDIIRGRGAVLTFNINNPIFHFIADPDIIPPDGLQQDYEFTIVSVAPDLVTVKGIKTGKTMYFYKKTDSTLLVDAFAPLKTLSNALATPPAWVVSIAGVISEEQVEEWVADAPNLIYEEEYAKAVPSVAITTPITDGGTLVIPTRVISLTYSVDKGMVEANVAVDGVMQKVQVHSFETTTVEIPFIAARSGTEISFFEPVSVAGKEINAMAYALDYVDEAGNNVISLTSTDADKTMKITALFPPVPTMERIVGTYTMEGYSYFGGAVTFTVTITKKSDDVVTIKGVEDSEFVFDATINVPQYRLEAEGNQYSGMFMVREASYEAYFDNAGADGPVYFDFVDIGHLSCSAMWGFYLPAYNNGAGAWANVYNPGVTFIRNE